MLILFTVWMIFGQVSTETTTRFTNLKCEVLDPTYCAYKYCYLKVQGRGIIALNVQAKLLKGPFNNAKVNLSLFRKFNGFRPFMFNATFDFCKFMAKNKGGISFAHFFLNIMAASSNVNHSCPYANEILVRDMILKEEYFKFLPLPSGEYQLQIMAATDGEWKTRISVNVLRQEDILKN